MAEGLLLLARRKAREMNEIETALAECLGVKDEDEGSGNRPYYGHVSDAMYSDYTLKELLRKIGAREAKNGK